MVQNKIKADQRFSSVNMPPMGPAVQMSMIKNKIKKAATVAQLLCSALDGPTAQVSEAPQRKEQKPDKFSHSAVH